VSAISTTSQGFLEGTLVEEAPTLPLAVREHCELSWRTGWADNLDAGLGVLVSALRIKSEAVRRDLLTPSLQQR
jgi:hypothetical protein